MLYAVVRNYLYYAERTILFLIFQLLEKKKRVQLKDMGEDLECLCQIMRTVGPRLDHAKAKVCASAAIFRSSLKSMPKTLKLRPSCASTQKNKTKSNVAWSKECRLLLIIKVLDSGRRQSFRWLSRSSQKTQLLLVL